MSLKVRNTVKNMVRKSYGAHTAKARGDMLDCALGTNVFGTPKSVVENARNYDWSKSWQYPDNTYRNLKQAICHLWADSTKLNISNIKIANGSSFNLSLINKMFIGPGVRVLGYAPQFTEYTSEVAVFGGTYEAVPLEPAENFKFNADRLLSRISSGYSIIYIDNPNNPTGQVISLDAIEAVAKEANRQETLVIVDEAYGDYLEEHYSAVNLMHKYPNIAVTRTFSKCYGIAQARVGYAILSDSLSHYYDQVDLPFSVATASAEMAREALLDKQFIADCRKWVRVEKEKVTDELKRRGFSISETCGQCPIFVTWRKNAGGNISLPGYFLKRGIVVLSGLSFDNLGEGYARINTPASAKSFITRLAGSGDN